MTTTERLHIAAGAALVMATINVARGYPLAALLFAVSALILNRIAVSRNAR